VAISAAVAVVAAIGVLCGCGARAVPRGAGVPLIVGAPSVPATVAWPSPTPAATSGATVNSPWVELGLDPAPLGTDADIRRAVDDLASMNDMLGPPPRRVVYARSTFGAVDDPLLNDPYSELVPRVPRPPADTPVVLIKSTCRFDSTGSGGMTLIMLDVTDSNILAMAVLLFPAGQDGSGAQNWAKYGRLTTLQCGVETCRCAYDGCDG